MRVFTQKNQKHARAEERGAAVLRVREVLRSRGQPLEPSTAASAGRQFGHDFSRVRVHADPKSAEAASALSARAFTVHPHIVFGVGEYAPHTESGSRLLAHELTHVVQQQAGVHLLDGAGRPGDPYERHAEAVADSLAQGRPAGPLLSAIPAGTGNRVPALQMQRLPDPKPKEKTRDLGIDALHASFQKLLEKSALKEKLYGAMARELARAYLQHRTPQPSFVPGQPLTAVPYVYDRLPRLPTEQEVYNAILGALDVKPGAKGTNATDWELKAPPAEGNPAKEVAQYGVENFEDIADLTKSKKTASKSAKDFEVDSSPRHFVGKAGSLGLQLLAGSDPKDLALDEARDLTVEYGARWLARKGLVEIAAILTGAYEIYGVYELLVSTLELIASLKADLSKKELSKSERIVRDVRIWLLAEAEQQEAAQAAEELARQRAKAKSEVAPADETKAVVRSPFPPPRR